LPHPPKNEAIGRLTKSNLRIEFSPYPTAFLAFALRRELAALKRVELDAVLQEMGSDPDYQAEVLQMEAEFAEARWEALPLGEASE
jgi:hypothetical protein